MENSVENKEQSGGRGVGAESGGESAVKYRLTGRVQQIGFRNYLAAAAEELQVRGWAKNESDESLVVFMQGAPAALSAMTPLLAPGSARGGCQQSRRIDGGRDRLRQRRLSHSITPNGAAILLSACCCAALSFFDKMPPW